MNFTTFLHAYIHGQIPCAFHELTGYYCPGCGGTRAVLALLHGHPLLSLYYHPIVVYTLAVLLLALVRHMIKKPSLSDGMPVPSRKKGRFAEAALWMALAIVIANAAVKNAVLFFLGISML